MIIPFKAAPTTTICKNCRHHINQMSNSSIPDIWYNQLCSASPLPTKVNPITGETQPYSINDLGQEYFTHTKFHFCRTINSGNCPKFKRKP